MAKILNTTWRSIMLANISYDLTLAKIGCSTVVLPTPTGPIIGRNMDWWPEDLLAKASCLIRYESGGKHRFTHAGWPGSVGVVTGLSGRGFAVVLNAVLCKEPFSFTGYPVLLHLRRVVEEAESFDEALELLRDQRLVAPALITLAGCNNDQRVVIERTPKRYALRWAEPGKPLVTTNDYRVLQPPSSSDDAEIYQTTCHRFDHLGKMLRNRDFGKTVSATELLAVLTDANVMQSITAQHVIIHPAMNSMQLYAPSHLV